MIFMSCDFVGYKRELNNKLYVKRFYKIPSILFPKDTLVTYLLYQREQLEDMTSTEKDEYIRSEMVEAGLDVSDEKLVSEIKSNVEKYIQQYKTREIDSSTGISRVSGIGMASRLDSNSSGKEIDMSFLNDFIRGGGNKTNSSEKILESVVDRATDGDMASTSSSDELGSLIVSYHYQTHTLLLIN